MRLKRIRQVAACVCFVLVTLLFLDFTGIVQGWFGWLAKIQFIPALLALNFGVVVALVLLTCVFGRVYCSVICPLGGVSGCGFPYGRQVQKEPFPLFSGSVMVEIRGVGFVCGRLWCRTLGRGNWTYGLGRPVGAV